MSSPTALHVPTRPADGDARRFRMTGITGRIFGGFAVVLLLMVGACGFWWHTLEGYAVRVNGALAAQHVTGAFQDMIMAATRFVSAPRPDEELAVRETMGEVERSIAQLAHSNSAVEAQADQLRRAAERFSEALSRHVAQQAVKEELIAGRVRIISDLQATLATVSAAQEKAISDIQSQLSEARERERGLMAKLPLLEFLRQAIMELKLTEAVHARTHARDDRLAVAEALRAVEGLVGLTVPDDADSFIGPLNDAERRLEEGGVTDVATTLMAAAQDVGSRLANALSEVNGPFGEALERLRQATGLGMAALRTVALADRVEGAEARLVPGPDGKLDPAVVAAVGSAVDDMRRSGERLLYWTLDREGRETLKALLGRLDDYRENMDRFATATEIQAESKARLDGETAAARAVATEVGDAELRAVETAYRRAIWLLVAGLAAAIMVGSAMSWWVGRGIARPLLRMVTVMRRLADGDIDVDIPGRARKDELRDIATAVEVFRDNAREVTRLNRRQEAMSRRAEEERRANMNQLAVSFDQMVKAVVRDIGDSTGRLRDTAGRLTQAADGALKETTTVAVAADRSSTDIQSVATAAEELTIAIGELARRVTDSACISHTAAEDTRRINAMMENLRSGADSIGGVIQLIQAIAGQTHLLALNATIEAARAGDVGKGFAVVASEVKALADQTADATDAIVAQIAAIQAETQAAVVAVKTVSETVMAIHRVTDDIAAAIEQQSAATAAISRSVQRAAHGTGEIANSAANVKRISEVTGESANDVGCVSDELGRQTDELNRRAEAFLNHVLAV